MDKEYVGAVKRYTTGIKGGGYITVEVSIKARDIDEARKIMTQSGDVIVGGPRLKQ